MKRILVLIVVFLFLNTSRAMAHPGRTDSNGGHVCKTNCEKWGLKDGEYHCHSEPVLKEVPEVKTEAKSGSKKEVKKEAKKKAKKMARGEELKCSLENE